MAKITFNGVDGDWVNVNGVEDGNLVVNTDAGLGDYIPLPTPNQLIRESDTLIGWKRQNTPTVYIKDYLLSEKDEQNGNLDNVVLHPVWKNNLTTYNVEPAESGRSGVVSNTQLIADINATPGEVWNAVIGAVVPQSTATATFIIPEITIEGVELDVYKFEVTFENSNWRFSEVTTEQAYIDAINVYVGNASSKGISFEDGYVAIWAKNGKTIDDSYLVSSNDVFTGNVYPKVEGGQNFVVLPVVYNDKVQSLLGDMVKWDLQSNVYGTRDDSGCSALAYGNVTVASPTNSISMDEKMKTVTPGTTDVVNINSTFGERLILNAIPKDGNTFNGWYRREHVVKDSTDNVLGYYLVSNNTSFTVDVDNNDQYNQYVALFMGNPNVKSYQNGYSFININSTPQTVTTPEIIGAKPITFNGVVGQYAAVCVNNEQAEGNIKCVCIDTGEDVEFTNVGDASGVHGILIANNMIDNNYNIPLSKYPEASIMWGVAALGVSDISSITSETVFVPLEGNNITLDLENGNFIIFAVSGYVPKIDEVEIPEPQPVDEGSEYIVYGDNMYIYNEIQGKPTVSYEYISPSPFYPYCGKNGRLMVNKTPFESGNTYMLSIVE